MTVAKYSTGQAAKMVGVDKVTLLRWLNYGLINPKPELITTPGAVPSWAWPKASIQAAKQQKGRLRRGPKPKAPRPARPRSL